MLNTTHRDTEPESFSDGCADTLADSGVVVRDGWLGAARSAALRTELVGLHSDGCFETAGVGQGPRNTEETTRTVRRDEVCWFRADGGRGMVAPVETARFLHSLAAVMGWLNRTCYLGLARVECHATIYGPAAFYRAHLDAIRGGSHRVISYCYYLNPDWQAGGELRILGVPGVTALDIAPLNDRLVLFRSSTVLHEVLPVLTHRLAMTGWLTTTAPA